MELTNEFSVSLPVDQAWALLTDIERIAPCMPGAELQEVDGDEYRGVVKVKVGPITARYKGAASFVERDETGHRAVVRAEGRDTRGQGNASATVTATLAPDGSGTHVTVHTDLHITGKVAQFGRGVLADVSKKLLAQFVRSLEQDVLAAPAPPTATAISDEAPVWSTANGQPRPVRDEPSGPAPEAGPRRIASTAAEPVDLLATAGSPVIKRVVPLVAVAVIVLWLLRRR